MRLGTTAAVLLGAVALVGVLGGCGGGSSDESPGDLLSRAKTVLDDASSAHFVLTSDGATGDGSALLGGEGDIARPASFRGTLQVQAFGSSAVDVQVVSVDGTVYAQLPLTSGFSVVDPAVIGVGDPGALLDPESGISQLLTATEAPTVGEQSRVDGEVVRQVSGTLPGQLVAELLTSQDPEQDVDAVYSIATDSGQLRQVQLTGPFFSADAEGSYTIALSDYGADVSITAPPTG
ncbi:LppX_LprAFG lipoprotein [Klenkia sp. PcliD-1-E]|uniref:LppX_LprAFG lipoprotein n=1 Tax=Klenkia sp. PcliD-1-E TaxID=2954492 RepID=UPI0020976A0D|nr:LppX_LprAFG lipoprotein [Klenkia sp. PcliD-1-E]MCO7220642.1 LppX_LprAFG lipoprotein [Klenkia sp. PcliD-1-E]